MGSQKVVCITGCTRGLGRAMVSEFIKRDFLVAGCGTNTELVQELTNTYGSNHLFQTVNVTEDLSVKSFSELIIEKLGTPTYLINNAGVINRNAPLWEITESEFSHVIDVNIKGVNNFIRHFVPAMIKAKVKGTIINFSSYWGQSTSADVAPYCASKWAIEGLSRGLADDLPQYITCVAFNPGVIQTDMLRSCFGSSAESYHTPDQWAKAALDLILSISPKDKGRTLTV